MLQFLYFLIQRRYHQKLDIDLVVVKRKIAKIANSEENGKSGIKWQNQKLRYVVTFCLYLRLKKNIKNELKKVPSCQQDIFDFARFSYRLDLKGWLFMSHDQTWPKQVNKERLNFDRSVGQKYLMDEGIHAEYVNERLQTGTIKSLPLHSG